jgi:hypothetical protein
LTLVARRPACLRREPARAGRTNVKNYPNCQPLKSPGRRYVAPIRPPDPGAVAPKTCHTQPSTDSGLALDQDSNAQLTERLRLLAADPKAHARYDAGTDRWSADFDSGNGLIVYIVNDDHRRVVILRVIHLS